MRLVRYRSGEGAALGVKEGSTVVPLSAIMSVAPDDLADLLRDGNSLEALGERAASARNGSGLRLDDLTLLPPVSRPGKIICLGVNYLDHAAESNLQKPEDLVVFLRSATSLIGHDAPMIRPNCSDQLDFECELAVFIGAEGRYLTQENALSIVAGYTAFNDGSIRDVQTRVSQWTLGKNFDGTGAVGPEFVSADELPEGAAGLRIQTRLNGQVMQDANTNDLLYDVRETIVRLTECLTLEPGDMIIMGTPGGVGLLRNPPLFMKPGDICEVEIEKIGILRNPIVQAAAVAKVREHAPS